MGSRGQVLSRVLWCGMQHPKQGLNLLGFNTHPSPGVLLLTFVSFQPRHHLVWQPWEVLFLLPCGILVSAWETACITVCLVRDAF